MHSSDEALHPEWVHPSVVTVTHLVGAAAAVVVGTGGGCRFVDGVEVVEVHGVYALRPDESLHIVGVAAPAVVTIAAALCPALERAEQAHGGTAGNQG